MNQIELYIFHKSEEFWVFITILGWTKRTNKKTSREQAKCEQNSGYIIVSKILRHL